MGSYILKRLFLMIPTLLGIMVLNFILIHAAPGGPIEHMISQMQDTSHQEAGGAKAKMIGGNSASGEHTTWNDEVLKDLNKRYGFDKPLWQRFWHMLRQYCTFNFGDSYFKSDSVAHLIFSRLPVSLSIGLWSTLIMYFVSIPLGMAKAVHNKDHFDTWSSVFVIIGYAIPSFLFALFLILVFAGGNFWSWFPLRGLTSSFWNSLSWWGKIGDYVWHLTLPTCAQVLGGFAALTFLTKNAFLEEIHKHYVIMARAQGFTEKAILIRYVFRNAMLVVISGLPSLLIRIFFAGSFLIEMIFSLDGLGLLSYEAVTTRDYPVIFGSLFLFTLLGLFFHLLSDLMYRFVDPRITFETQS